MEYSWNNLPEMKLVSNQWSAGSGTELDYYTWAGIGFQMLNDKIWNIAGTKYLNRIWLLVKWSTRSQTLFQYHTWEGSGFQPLKCKISNIAWISYLRWIWLPANEVEDLEHCWDTLFVTGTKLLYNNTNCNEFTQLYCEVQNFTLSFMHIVFKTVLTLNFLPFQGWIEGKEAGKDRQATSWWTDRWTSARLSWLADGWE